MYQIPVFAAEKKDGIAELVQASASIAYISPTRVVSQKSVQDSMKVYHEKSIAASHKDQFDLFYLDTILVTTGWNKNDDVFLKDETWAARHSPEDKPFNFGHDQLDIIGHITANSVVDEDYNVIADDSVLDDVPEKFHILTGAVIYKAWSDKEQRERIEKIIAEIAEDKWFVSMECLFRGFNYGVASANGEKRVIARSEDTAFLTKHLRAYGGTGKYQDFKIGRVLSNLNFSGKGLVENPANPESIIFNNVATFKSTFANLGYINAYGSNSSTSEEIDMADNDRTVELQKAFDLVKADADKAKAENEKLIKRLEEVQVQAAKASEDKINSLTAAVEDEKKKKKEAEDKADAAEKEVEKLKKEVDKSKAEADSLKKSLDDNAKASRVQKAKVDATEEEVQAFIKEWDGVSEAQFNKALELWAAKSDSGSLAPSITAPKVGTMKPGSDKGVQKVNAEEVIDSGEAGQASAAHAANVGQTESTQAALSNFLEKNMKNTKARDRRK